MNAKERLDEPNAERVAWNESARRGARAAVWDDLPSEPHIERIREGLRPLRVGGIVLDLGCGIGRIAVPLSKQSLFTTFACVDISAEMLRKLPKRPNMRAVLCDGRNLPPDITYGYTGAYSMLTFQHIPALAVKGYIEQVAKVLQPLAPFVFQYVEGRNETFLAHDLSEPVVRQWCVDASLRVDTVETETAPGYESWRWVYARKATLV